MTTFLKGAGWLGTIITLVLLLIALVRQLMAFVSFLMFALKAGIVLDFVGLIALILIVIWRDYNKKKRAAAD